MRLRAISLEQSWPRTIVVMAVALLTSGCPGDAGDGGEAGTQAEADTRADTSEAGTGSSGAGTGTGSGTDATATAADTTTTATGTTTTDPDTTEGGTSSGLGVCAAPCRVAADCESDNLDCVDGFCELSDPFPPCDPVTCEAISGVCTFVDGNSACVTPCNPAEDDCPGVNEMACTGIDDEDASFCEWLPCFGLSEGEPCQFSEDVILGICIDGACQCTSDADCSPEGIVCNL